MGLTNQETACLAEAKPGFVHPSRVEDNTLRSHMASDAPPMTWVSYEKLYHDAQYHVCCQWSHLLQWSVPGVTWLAAVSPPTRKKVDAMLSSVQVNRLSVAAVEAEEMLSVVGQAAERLLNWSTSSRCWTSTVLLALTRHCGSLRPQKQPH